VIERQKVARAGRRGVTAAAAGKEEGQGACPDGWYTGEEVVARKKCFGLVTRHASTYTSDSYSGHSHAPGHTPTLHSGSSGSWGSTS
jgi:hypothetical protein